MGLCFVVRAGATFSPWLFFVLFAVSFFFLAFDCISLFVCIAINY